MSSLDSGVNAYKEEGHLENASNLHIDHSEWLRFKRRYCQIWRKEESQAGREQG
jgi:hypothetical protein